MQKTKLFLFVGLLSLFFIGQLPAEEPGGNLTPEGYWKTIDDKTGEVKSIVKLWIAEDGTIKGRCEKVFPKEGEDPNPICDKCKGDKKDQPVLGMEILWGFEGAGAEWKNGKALDPENGKIYNCQLEVIENGKKLKVFGYIRIIFKIGRSQIWLRESVDQ
ncbi:DUF2147 domain-containing protein [Acidobacteriota bacterium]